MKALKLSLIAVLACVCLIGCKKDELSTKDQYTKYLTDAKGWVLASATASPYYVTNENDTITNIYTDYLYECELDEIIKFNENGGMTINPGKNICEDSFGYQAEVAAVWSLDVDDDDDATLNMQLPFFYNDEATSYDTEVENCEILSLTEKEMRLKYTFNVSNSPAKEKCSFVLTYKAK